MQARERTFVRECGSVPPLSRNVHLAYIAHSIRSDWNNGNAHFLRGLLRAMTSLGHKVSIFEPESDWSIDNLRSESAANRSLAGFYQTYPELHIETYDSSGPGDDDAWRERLRGVDVAVLHEWNPPALAQQLIKLREELRFKLLFHDTHHRASSSPAQIQQFGLASFDGVLAFGEALRGLYQERFAIEKVWTFHEAADTTVFFPRSGEPKQTDVVWVGNWGEGERAQEIHEFLLGPAALLAGNAQFTVHGVRYPPEGLSALREAHVQYAGYLPNLKAPCVYGAARLTVHIPRQQYTSAMCGIPTIRVFEALASGIPLVSAPWTDQENLFRLGDFLLARNTAEMVSAMKMLLRDPEAAALQAERGLATVLARHTCGHRAKQLTEICQELLQ